MLRFGTRGADEEPLAKTEFTGDVVGRQVLLRLGIKQPLGPAWLVRVATWMQPHAWALIGRTLYVQNRGVVDRIIHAMNAEASDLEGSVLL